MRHVCSYLRRHGDVAGKIPRDKPEATYFGKAVDALRRRKLVYVVPGWWSQNVRLRRARMYGAKEVFLEPLMAWEGAASVPPPRPKKRHLRHLLRDWNAIYAQHSYTGFDTPVMVRYFKDRNGQPHGRMYALGANSYQRRKDRYNGLIDGRPLIDIDISASQPTAFLTLNGFDFSMGLGERGDLYDIGGFHREAVKVAVMLMIGKGTTEGLSWYQHADSDGNPPERGHPCWKYKIGDVVAALLAEYPLFEKITPEDQYRLVLAESNIVFYVVEQMLAIGIVALPTHDSILVQEEHEATAKAILAARYELEFGRRPILKTKRNTNAQAHRAASGPNTVGIDELIHEILAEATVPTIRLSSYKDSIIDTTNQPTIIFDTRDSNSGDSHKTRGNPAFKPISDDKRAQIVELHQQGMSIRRIAAKVGVGKNTVSRVIKAVA